MSNPHARWETFASEADTLTGSPSSSPTASRFDTGSTAAQPNSKYSTSALESSGLPPDFPTSIPDVRTTDPNNANGRNLVLCFDGTGDQFDSDNSNVVEFMTMLRKDDPERQLVYYQSGIGTYTIPQVATPIYSKIRKAIDGAIANSINAHIMSGYEFLMQNYRARDKICIFGFSRGAYTARCLAGMLHKIGLLPSSNHQQVPFAYKMYTRTDELGWSQANAFKKAFTIDVAIHFLGVWDTVSSVGVIPRRLPFSTSSTVVRTFRHALSLDERRARFQPNVWNKPTVSEEFLSISDQQVEIFKQKNEEADLARKATGKKRQGLTLRALEEQYGGSRAQKTDVKEVWFAGAHCDVGGGSVTNGVKPCLARIPLRWMIRECFRTDSGIIFTTLGIARTGIHPQTLWPKVLDRPDALPLDTSKPETCRLQCMPPPQPVTIDAFTIQPQDLDFGHLLRESEEEHDRKDALAPVFDQLSLDWKWWILELIPMSHKYQKYDGDWTRWFGANLGRGRHIPHMKHHGVLVHRTVKTRLEAEPADGGSQKYWPNSNLDLQYVRWTD